MRFRTHAYNDASPKLLTPALRVRTERRECSPLEYVGRFIFSRRVPAFGIQGGALRVYNKATLSECHIYDNAASHVRARR